MEAQEIWNAVSQGEAIVLDVRPPMAFSQGHVPQAVNAPFQRGAWGPAVKRWLAGQSPRLVLFGDNAMIVEAAAKALEQEQLTVWARWTDGIDAWRQANLPVVEVKQITVDALHQERDQWVVIDVREPYELRSGMIPNAMHIPLDSLPQHVEKLDQNQRYAVVCAHGSRSQAAAAFLADKGFQVGTVVGGMALWLGAGYPTMQPSHR